MKQAGVPFLVFAFLPHTAMHFVPHSTGDVAQVQHRRHSVSMSTHLAGAEPSRQATTRRVQQRF